MTGPGNLKENFLLALEHDLPVVDAPGGVHEAVGFGELFAGKAFVSLSRLLNSVFCSGGFGIRLGRHAVP